ncbi:MAG: TIGR01212 family radical SAM protein [Rikenellaceae bacterium]|nr:TIGR01212 family radical SAM protein [Rikenellaceae bacterium]
MPSEVKYPWGDDRRFNSYAGYFRKIFGHRVQKVTVNAGFTCPNRDGTLGTGGCTFCDNAAFTPSYCMKGEDVAWQIKEGISFHRNRYRRAGSYLVYFQSFSNTYAPLDTLRDIYSRALAVPGVEGIIVGTRPDCIDDEKLDYLADLAKNKYVAIEYGVESCRDETLRNINRGHDFACARTAIEKTASRGIHTGAHFILGLPGETDRMLLDGAGTINSLPLTSVKFHQLQIFKGTAMSRQWEDEPGNFHFKSIEEYIALFAQILRRLRPDLIIERFASEAPPRYHAGPNWGLVRNDRLLSMLEQYLEVHDYHQGQLL